MFAITYQTVQIEVSVTKAALEIFLKKNAPLCATNCQNKEISNSPNWKFLWMLVLENCANGTHRKLRISIAHVKTILQNICAHLRAIIYQNDKFEISGQNLLKCSADKTSYFRSMPKHFCEKYLCLTMSS